MRVISRGFGRIEESFRSSAESRSIVLREFEWWSEGVTSICDNFVRVPKGFGGGRFMEE